MNKILLILFAVAFVACQKLDEDYNEDLSKYIGLWYCYEKVTPIYVPDSLVVTKFDSSEMYFEITMDSIKKFTRNDASSQYDIYAFPVQYTANYPGTNYTDTTMSILDFRNGISLNCQYFHPWQYEEYHLLRVH